MNKNFEKPWRFWFTLLGSGKTPLSQRSHNDSKLVGWSGVMNISYSIRNSHVDGLGRQFVVE